MTSSSSTDDRELTARPAPPEAEPAQAAQPPSLPDVSSAPDDERPGFLLLLLRALSAWNV